LRTRSLKGSSRLNRSDVLFQSKDEPRSRLPY
jgi:hypothetical protein